MVKINKWIIFKRDWISVQDEADINMTTEINQRLLTDVAVSYLENSHTFTNCSNKKRSLASWVKITYQELLWKINCHYIQDKTRLRKTNQIDR